MRPRFALTALTVALIATAACTASRSAPRAAPASRRTPAPPQAAVNQGLLWINTARGVAVVDPANGSPRVSADGAVAAPDASALVVDHVVGDATKVESLDPATGKSLATTSLPGTWRVRAVSIGGARVALRRGTPTATELAVVSPSGATRPKIFPLAGNFVPDAFASDGAGLFVLEYLPALHPDHYRVRYLHLASGELSDVYTREKQLPEEMSGASGAQVYARGNRVLYTLYTEAKEAGHAFVHTLGVDGSWVHCIDLPKSLGFGAPGTPSHGAIALAPDERTLYVLGPSGRVAIIDTDTLAVRSTVAARATGAIAAGADHVWVSEGPRLVRVDSAPTGTAHTVTLPAAATALTETADGTRLYVTAPGHLFVLDATTGVLQRDIASAAVGLATAQAVRVT